jgi:hypothetical protein
VYPEQTVSEMVDEVLERQATNLADRSGETLERATSATLKTEAARQLKELSESAYGEQKRPSGKPDCLGRVPRSATTRGWRATWGGWKERRGGHSTMCSLRRNSRA